MQKINIKHHFLAFGFIGLLFVSCSTSHRVISENGSRKIYNLKYGEHKRNVMDVFLPQNISPSSPVVMIIHGGGWVIGRKEHMKMVRNRLWKENVPTVSINYRLVRPKKGITYKEELEDISQAISQTQQNASEWNINPQNLVLLGESAGGHLALLYGYTHPDQVKKIVSMSGPTDFYSDQYLNSFYSKYSSILIEDMVGEKFDRKNLSDDFKKASPLANISNVPTLIFQGDTDRLVNKNQGLRLASELEKRNIPHKLIYMKNSGHTPRFFSKKKRDSIIFPNILEFIKE